MAITGPVKHPLIAAYTPRGGRAERYGYVEATTAATIPELAGADLPFVSGGLYDGSAEQWDCDVLLGRGGFWSRIRDDDGSCINDDDVMDFLAGRRDVEFVTPALDRAFAGTPVGLADVGPEGVGPVVCRRGDPEADLGHVRELRLDRDGDARRLARFLAEDVAFVDGSLAMRRRPVLVVDAESPCHPEYAGNAPMLPTWLPVRPDTATATLDLIGKRKVAEHCLPPEWLALARHWPDEPDDALATLNGHAANVLRRLDIGAKLPETGADGRAAMADVRRGMAGLAARAALGLAGADDLQGDLDLFRRALDLAHEYGGRGFLMEGMPVLRDHVARIVLPRVTRVPDEDWAAVAALG